jgi:Domain of unknown function (DUF4157)
VKRIMAPGERTRSAETPDKRTALPGAGDPSRVAAARVGEVPTVSPSEAAASFDFATIPIFDSPWTLPQPLLTGMERSFGENFTKVRIHEGPGASTVGAIALAQGNELHFAPGHYRPGTPAGDALIGHELTHVVQQRRGQDAGSGGGGQAIIRDRLLEHEARQQGNLAARGDPVVVRGWAPFGSIQRDDSGSNSSKQSPAKSPPTSTPAPLKYDFRAHPLKPLPAGSTLANIKLDLKKKIDAGEIKSATPIGVTPGSTEEIFVLYALSNLAEKTRWRTEADLVTAIGWPAKVGDPEPQGRITVRIDDQGAASAELIAAGPVPKPPQMTVAAGSAQLKTDYKLASVRDDGSVKWTDAEISDVVAALALVPGPDKPALEGVELIRVKTLPDSGIALFSGGGGVAKEATKITQVPSLQLSNRAFPATVTRFVGGKPKTLPETFPATFHTILHEIGHAVESAVYRPVNAAYDEAIIESHKKGIALNESAAAYKKAEADYNALYAQYQAARKAGDTKLENSLSTQLLALDKTKDTLLKANRARAEENRKAEAAEKTAEAAVAKTRVPAAVVAPFKADAAKEKKAADAALSAARATLKAMSAPDLTSSAAYVKSVEDTATAIATFATSAAAATGGTSRLETTVLAQTAARGKARDALSSAFPSHAALTTLAPVETAQDVWLEAERALAEAERRSLRLQKFVDLVTKNKIERFTEYSEENWRLVPGEFYAEAYGLWLTDPEYLMNNYKTVYEFFQSGDYRK